MIEINKIYNGDCLDVLKTFEDNFIDSCVTDPPYGISFMNKHWDYQIPSVEIWEQVLRVLKPGGHLLCACGTRTQHRTTVNIEDAGFEIRDVITWHYGSGFPKSLDVAKAIEGKITIGSSNTKDIKKLSGTTTLNPSGTGRNDVEQGYRDTNYVRTKTDVYFTTNEAKQWEGWGTALKPATEFWTLARKPISENTIAENVLKHGTGGINIDGSRIETEDDTGRPSGVDPGMWAGKKQMQSETNQQGRFPANVIFDEFTGKILDEQSGELTSGYMAAGTPRKNSECEGRNTYGEMKPDLSKEDTYADSGGASRYFLNVKSGELCGFFTYFYTLINTEISCGNTLENQKVVGFVNGVTLEIEKFTLSEGLFTDGKKLTESCQPDTKFTIEILIKLMTELKTCNFLRGMNIEWYTQEQTKIINSLMELKIGDASVVKNISHLLNLHLEMLEHIRDIVNRVQAKSYENGEVQIENDTTNIIENTGRFRYTPKADNFERNKGVNKERWFYDLELITDFGSFTEQNLFVWERQGQNQNMDFSGEVQQQKDTLEDMMLIVADNEWHTTLNGKNIMDLFPKAIRFTTKTKIKQTITLQTSNYYQPLNINDCMEDVIKTNKENGLNLAENAGIKNLLKAIFTKGKMGFPRGVKIVAKKTPQLINVKDAWPKRNIHSTVKPIDLMRYLVKLITPKHGICIDPFCGSGTTLIGCKLELIKYIGIDTNEEYCKIAEARVAAWNPEKYIEQTLF